MFAPQQHDTSIIGVTMHMMCGPLFMLHTHSPSLSLSLLTLCYVHCRWPWTHTHSLSLSLSLSKLDPFTSPCQIFCFSPTMWWYINYGSFLVVQGEILIVWKYLSLLVGLQNYVGSWSPPTIKWVGTSNFDKVCW